MENCKYFANTQLLSSFLKDVRKFDVLTTEEEEQLFLDYKNGDKSARDKLINSNLRWIYSEAKKYALNEDEVLDYVNEGVIGLMEALDKYDESLGFKMLTYARWYVKRNMGYYLDDTKKIVCKSNNIKIGKKIDAIRKEFFTKNEREATIDEIKEILLDKYGIDVKDDSDIYDLNVDSIDYEIDEDYTMEDNSVFNNVTSSINDYEKEIHEEYNHIMASRVLKMLKPTEKKIISMLYGIGYERSYGVDEISEFFGVNSRQVIRIKDNALKRVKENMVLERVAH